jgi:hypothetical protein
MGHIGMLTEVSRDVHWRRSAIALAAVTSIRWTVNSSGNSSLTGLRFKSHMHLIIALRRVM